MTSVCSSRPVLSRREVGSGGDASSHPPDPEAARTSILRHLHDASQIGDVETVKRIFETHPELHIDVTRRGRNTTLHTALLHNQEGMLLDYLIKNGADVNVENTKGYSPLALAIIHCKETKGVEKLIAAGAKWEKFDSGAFAGNSALEVAVKHNNEKVIELLKNESVVDICQEISSNVTPRKGRSICPICSVQVKFPTQMSRIMADQAAVERRMATLDDEDGGGKALPGKKRRKKYSSRRYMDQLLAHSDGATYEKLCGIEYHHVENMRLRKEISESYAILHAVQECCAGLGIGNGSADDNVSVKDVFLIDLCSGKGITTAICGALAEEDSNNYFLAVDKMLPHTVPHFLNNDTIQYLCRDIMSEDLEYELADMVRYQTREMGRTCILVGMHLCGLLSQRAIDFFERIKDIKGLVLSPCCLPKKHQQRHIEFKKAVPEEGEENADLFNYFRWSNHLKDRIDRLGGDDDRVSDVRLYTDDEMHTDKNAIIRACRPSS